VFSQSIALLKRVRNLLPDNKVVLFLLKLFTFYILWYFLNGILADTNSPLFLKFWYGGYHILLKSAMFLSIQITSVFTDIQITNTYRNIIIENHGSLYIANACLAADVMYMFAVFIIAYPGKRKNKFWFIPMGILVIQMISTLRIAALCLTKIYQPEMMYLNHHFLFNIFILVAVFIMWVIWITRFSKTDLLENKENKNKSEI
jgi:exosortase/archaeosortase family protein